MNLAVTMICREHSKLKKQQSQEIGQVQNQNDIWNRLTFQTKVEYSQKFIS